MGGGENLLCVPTLLSEIVARWGGGGVCMGVYFPKFFGRSVLVTAEYTCSPGGLSGL